MKKILSIFLIGLLAACTSVKISNTESAANTDFEKYKTFGFYKLMASGDTTTSGFFERVDVLKSAISDELNKRGYTQSNNPEILVNIGIQIEKKTQTRQTDWRTDGAYRYMGQRNYSWKSEELVVGHYKEGTVTIHMIDVAQNRMIWKGTAQDILPRNSTKIPEAAAAGMKALFAKYPIAPKK